MEASMTKKEQFERLQDEFGDAVLAGLEKMRETHGYTLDVGECWRLPILHVAQQALM